MVPCALRCWSPGLKLTQDLHNLYQDTLSDIDKRMVKMDVDVTKFDKIVKMQSDWIGLITMAAFASTNYIPWVIHLDTSGCRKWSSGRIACQKENKHMETKMQFGYMLWTAAWPQEQCTSHSVTICWACLISIILHLFETINDRSIARYITSLIQRWHRYCTPNAQLGRRDALE